MKYARACCSIIHNRVDHTFTYIGKCIVTGKSVAVTVPEDGVNAYNNGALLQNAFPGLTADERDFLLCGVGPGNMDAFVGRNHEIH